MTRRKIGLRRQNYDFPPFRPPSEADSLLLRVTRGCPWNRCSFCSMYKDTKFEIRDVDEVIGDITLAKKLYGTDVRTVFIGDSNSLIVRTTALVEILRALCLAFPNLTRVTSYARAQTLARKSEAELADIRQAGLTRLHVGLETGDPELLKHIQKGATPEEMVDAGKKSKAAGFEYSLYVLLGVGGEARWESHARGTADVLNRIDPHFIRVRTLIPLPGCGLFDAMTAGTFVPATPETILRETRLLIEELNVTSTFLSDHVSNLASVDGKLPEEKAALLAGIDETLRRLNDDDELRKRMEMIRRQTRL